MKNQQNFTAGIILFLLADFFIVAMNAFAKGAAPHHAPVEILFYRSIVAMFFLLAYLALTVRRNVYKTTRIKSHIWRALIGNAGVVLNFQALSLMPMADVTALLFTAPLMVTILAALILKEQVASHRWLAVVAGFAGVLLISHPAGQNLALPGLLAAMGSALCNALVILLLRDLGRTEDALTTVFYFLSFGILFSGIYMIFFGHMPYPHTAWLLAGTGIAGGLQLLLKTQAYRIAEASLLSPFTYISLLWATLIGLIFWGSVPTIWTAAGAAIIIASNLFIIWREGQIK